ncbi:MAG: non-canonical purine NTP pyrophosphatase, RdgB/HAM1 family [Candidatus Aminicenantes bacterium]|nr:non-canonical purine NTP pyrophosphatase, RdgB/HAM1 family [Candidatus Aminicenantes bacterium]
MKPERPRLLIATTNKGKAAEIAAGLRGVPYEIVTLGDVGPLGVCREGEVSFAENARRKALFYSRRTGLLTLAEDSGLEVAALDGAPGVRSARFAGSGADDASNNRKTLRLLRGFSRERRRGRFVSWMALARDGKILKVVRGVVRGTIAREEVGSRGFGYDPIFYYHPFRKTFGQVSPRAKNAVSHRGRALAVMSAFLRGRPPKRRRGDRPPAPRRPPAAGPRRRSGS